MAPGCSPSNPSVEGELTVGVLGKNVTGTGNWVEQAYSCGGVEAGPFPFSFPVTGTKSGNQFNLQLGPDTLAMTIEGSTASGTVDVFGAGGYGSSLTFTLNCQNRKKKAVG